MKTFALILATLTVGFIGLMAQRRTAVPVKPSDRVLVDFRVTRKTDQTKIPLATQQGVLSQVFMKYLSDDSKCVSNFEPSGDDFLKSARDAGQIVPSIVDVATGSFTEAGKAETAYVISVSECNASHAEAYGSKRVAIFAGQQLVADMDVDYKSSIVLKTDLDADGVNELLMASGDMAQGTITEMAALMDFQNGRVRVLEDLGTVNEDSCASEIPGSTVRAALISAAEAGPGKMPKLRIDNYEMSCRRGSRWRFISTGKLG